MGKILPVVLLFLAFISCGPVYTSITVPEFLNKRFEDFTLAIAPYNNAPAISYRGSVREEFGEGNINDLIEKHFTETLVENCKQRSTFAQVQYAKYQQTPKLTPAVYDLGNMFKLEISIPDTGTILTFEACTADYVLLFEDVSLGTYQEYGRAPGMMIGGGGFNTPPMYITSPRYTDKYLQYQAEFVFWDNMNGRVVTYGRIKCSIKADYFNIIQREHWDQVDNDFVEDLLTGSPFKK